MATFNPQQYANKSFGMNAPEIQQLTTQYGFTPQQLSGLHGGAAGTASPSLALGTSGYNLTSSAGGGGYMIQPQKAAPIPATAAKAPATPAASTPGGLAPASTFNSPAGTPQGAQPTLQTTFRDTLLKQLGTDPNAVSLTDPDLAPQAKAYQNAQQRSQERFQQDLAEQAFAGGTGNTGAYGLELGAAEQQRGENEAQFEAGLLKDAKQQRLESLFAALGLGQQQIQSDETIRAQRNAAALQHSLGLSDIDLRRFLGTGQLELGKGQLGLGLLQTLLQNNQANNTLGANVGMFGANLNQNSVLRMLGL